MSKRDATNRSPVKMPPPNLWIVSWWQDLLYFIGPPLFLVPLCWVILQGVSLERFAVLVVSFGAVGHHFPGMLRAYGDADLFSRYRVRFLLAPIFLIAISITYSFLRPDALVVLVLVWGLWHSQAQVYGFLRIYDSKAALFDPRTARIDQLLCLSWFIGGMLMSNGRMSDLLTVFYRVGGATISAEMISAIRYFSLATIALSTVIYFLNSLNNWRRGLPPSPVKFVSLVLSIGFWWYCMVGIRNVVLGVALYEVFHDIQYLAIVWFFNRRRSESPTAGWFTRFLFRPRMTMVLLYIGLVLAYGSGSLLARNLDRSVIQKILTGMFVASGLLHFYFDGFIWKIRERGTSQTLGVQNSTSRQGFRSPTWLTHLASWMVFATPLILLTFTSEANVVHERVVLSLPTSAEAHFNLAAENHKAGELDVAEQHAREALKLNQSWSKPWSLLGEVLISRNLSAQAVPHLQRAVELDPFNAIAYFNLGNALIKEQQIDAATDAYLAATRLDPKYESSSYNNLGSALLELRAFDDAKQAFQQAVQANPSNTIALKNLADLLLRLGETREAVQFYEQALLVQPENKQVFLNLIRLHLSNERINEAGALIERYQENFPIDPTAYTSLGLFLLAQDKFPAAESAFQYALELAPDHFPAKYGIAQLHLKQGHWSQCMKTLDAIESSPSVTVLQKRNIQMIRTQLLIRQQESS